ncbi:MAG: HEAT repeat domain-containing protein [Myxococcota bacterium]
MPRRALLAFTAVVAFGCSSGRDKLIADLQSARPEVRALAVKQLAEKFDSDDVGLFTQAARDSVAIVRAEAMTALGKSQDERVVDLLGEALGDSDEQVQLKAAAALASFKSAKARGYLTLQYSRRGRSTRLAIVQGLKGANIPGAMASVVAAEAAAIWERNVKVLQNGTLPERAGAAEELGRSGRPEAVNRLVPLLKDNQVVLAAAAARGLGFAGDARAVPAVTALLDENFPELREAACEALAALGDASAVGKLLTVAQEKSPTSPFATAAMIALPKTPETARALCELTLTGGDQDVQAAGREMRRRGGCPPDPIAEKLKSPTPQPALAAIAALGPGLKDLAPKIVPFLTATDAQTRKLAVDALAELGDPSVAAPLLKAWDAEMKLLEPIRSDWIPAELPTTFAPGFDPSQPLPADDPSAVVKARTSELFRRVEALDAQRAQEAGKTLIKPRAPREVLDDGNDEQLKVLASLIRALGRLKIDGAREKVQPYTRDGSVSLRAAAWAALAFLGENSKEGLLDSERAVQGATAQALVDAGPDGQRLVLETMGQLAGDRTRLLEPLRGVSPPRDAAPILVGLIKEGGAEAALAAAILGDMQAADAVPALQQLLEDPTAVARREVLLVLGRMRDPRSADVVARDLYSDRDEVRAAAAEALGQLGAAQHLEAIDALKGDYYRRVRDAASSAVGRLGASKPAEGVH